MSVTAKKNFRICIVSEQLAGGGAERCSAILSQFFVANNCSVHHVLVIDRVEYVFSGEILNLGRLKNGRFNVFDRINRLKMLNNFFKDNQFDFIIDTRVINRQLQEYLIAKFVYNAPIIKVVHSFMTNLYFPKSTFLAKSIYSNAVKIVTVSKAIEIKVKEKYNYDQLQTIYNPIDFDFVHKCSRVRIDIDFNYILAVGNMNSDVKQFDKLINCYSNSILPNSNCKLIIIGDGAFKLGYEEQVSSLNLQDKILFKGKIDNPFPYFRKAIFTVLTSKNEGFPTVLLESLACETPVVSFDCKSGPSEIIIHHENGILVENQNQFEFIQAINQMFLDKNLYLHCKSNTLKSIENFSLDIIGEQWLQLLNKLHEY